MPIADDIKQFYPDDWGEIRERVLERAANRETTEAGHPMPPVDGSKCEWCGKPDGMYMYVYPDGVWSLATEVGRGPDSLWEGFDEYGQGEPYILLYGPEGEPKGGDYACHFCEPAEPREITVVLTVAHLDQDPRGDDIERLRALCQRCHLTYDNRPEQRAKRERIYAELRGQRTLFQEAQ